MLPRILLMVLLTVSLGIAATTAVAEVSGTYIEARTCQVYTGPCFANGEVGLAGKEAVMAWNIEAGQHEGVDLAGLNIEMVIKSNETIGFRRLETAETIGATVMVDERATLQQPRSADRIRP